MTQGQDKSSLAPWALPAGMGAALAAAAILAWLFKAHCLFGGGWSASEQYVTGCYSDFVPFWGGRGVAAGEIPYLQASIEYPVLTGLMIWIEGGVTRVLFGSGAGELPFLTVATLANAGLLAAIVTMMARMEVARDRLMLLILGPPIILYLGHNWDVLAVALTVLAIHLHRGGRAFAAGAAVGLGAAAKLFPLLLLPLLLFDWFDRRDFRRLALTAGGAILAWLVVNLPVALAAPERWAEFYVFSRERAGTFAATWSLIDHMGIGTTVEERNGYGSFLFMAGAAGITLANWRRFTGRMWMLITPVVALFLLTNKVYSPQFDLWLVPLLLLTSRRLWPLAALYVATTLVYWMEFWFFAGQDNVTPSVGYGMLVAAAWLRMIVLSVIIALPFFERMDGQAEAATPAPN